jgi:hypothetical protein
MQYLLMLYVQESGWTKLSPAEQEQGMADYIAYTDAMAKAGVLRQNGQLHSSQAATTIRLVDGKPRVLDGPYADSKEQVGGFYIIDVPDLDAALSWAARCPAVGHGIVEVRPIRDLPAP